MTTNNLMAPAGRRRSTAGSVTNAMVTTPQWCAPTATVGELRHFFADAHVHAALVVDDHILLAVIDRDDLTLAADTVSAADVGALLGRAVRDTADLATAERTMRASGRRRLAVVDADGRCVGLLCLKSSGSGFCTDDDLAARRQDRVAKSPDGTGSS